MTKTSTTNELCRSATYLARLRTRTRLIELMLIVVVILGVSAPSRAERRFELIDDDVVVFAGGTNIVRLQQAGYLEASLTRAFASSRPRFRDWAWEADTVFHQRTVIERCLYLLGLDHEQLTYHYAGRDFRLTDVHGKVVADIVA